MTFNPVRAKPITFYIDENKCFICTSHARDWDGYPLLFRRGKTIRISRFIYEECYGLIPNNHIVRHKCDNPNCISPEHLVIGTYQQNSDDMVSRNRSAKGIKNASAKLTESDVLSIRKEYKKDVIRMKDLSEKYGVSITVISNVIKNKSWRHI